MKIHEKVVCGGGKSLWKMPEKKSFWGGIENFRFCLGGGEVTLDDTMIFEKALTQFLKCIFLEYKVFD